MTTPNPPQPGPQQPYPGPPTQPQGYPAGPGAPGAGPQPGYPPAPPQQKKKFPVRIVVGLVIAAVVIVIVLVLRQSDPDSAKVGDCMAGSSAENLKVVKCTDAKAQYKVVGKVENKSQTDFSINSAGICKAYPTAESAFWKGERGGKGYVLCLGPNK